MLNVGNVVELGTRLPSTSTLAPRVRVLDAAGVPVADEDGDPADGHFLATISADGEYYAEVQSGYWVYNGHRYLIAPSQTWTDAETYAQSLGGHLATIDDQAEQDWVNDTFAAMGDLWLGLNDVVEEGTWVWSSGDAVAYTNWLGGEPNSGGNYDGAYLHYADGLWYDGYNTWSKLGLIELDSAVGPDGQGPGPRAQYLLDVDVSDPIPPQVTDVSRLPAEGGTTEEMISTFAVTVSEALMTSTVNTPQYEFATYNGHTYVWAASRTWFDADAYAQSLGGSLVTVDDQAEQDWLHDTFGDADSIGGATSFWTGLNDAAADETWVWASGDPVGYTNWAGGEPNTASYDGSYVETSNGLWYDYHKTWGLPSVVEFGSDTDTDADGLPDVLDSHPSDPLNGWDLREAGIDGLFDTPDDDIHDLRVEPVYAGGTTINLRLHDGPMHDGHFRLMVTPSLTDMVGNALDGNADGTGGDAYVQTFDVDLADGLVYEGRHNADRAEATPFPLAEDPTGSGLFLGFGLGSIDPSSDQDWWSFEAQAGDRVAVALDTPDSGLRAQLYLYGESGGYLARDYYGNAGPDDNAYISHYAIPSDGTYYVQASYYSGSVGTYELRMELARGIDLESDAEYANDALASADVLVLEEDGIHRTTTIAGTIMAPQWQNNADEDLRILVVSVS